MGLEFVLLLASYFPPQHLKINGDAWKVQIVKQVSAGSGYDGMTHCETRTIELEASGPEEMRDTAEHEVMHALACNGQKLDNTLWNNTKTGYHAGIYRMAPRLVQFERENPQFVAWIQR